MNDARTDAAADGVIAVSLTLVSGAFDEPTVPDVEVAVAATVEAVVVRADDEDPFEHPHSRLDAMNSFHQPRPACITTEP